MHETHESVGDATDTIHHEIHTTQRVLYELLMLFVLFGLFCFVVSPRSIKFRPLGLAPRDVNAP